MATTIKHPVITSPATISLIDRLGPLVKDKKLGNDCLVEVILHP